MAGATEKSVVSLLATIKLKFPERKRAAEDLFRSYGLTETYDLKIAPPVAAQSVPTFRPGTTRPLTASLQSRFNYAGAWQMGQDIWLDTQQMQAWLKDKNLMENHLARREDWLESAPMLYPDEQLALFGITEAVPENAIYLVWTSALAVEPEVWTYEGMKTKKFSNLEEFLRWNIERE